MKYNMKLDEEKTKSIRILTMCKLLINDRTIEQGIEIEHYK